METLLNKYLSAVSDLVWGSELPLIEVHSVCVVGAMEECLPILRLGEEEEVGQSDMKNSRGALILGFAVMLNGH